jgi:hypothetical protein
VAAQSSRQSGTDRRELLAPRSERQDIFTGSSRLCSPEDVWPGRELRDPQRWQRVVGVAEPASANELVRGLYPTQAQRITLRL